MIGISRGIPVVNTTWLDAIISAGALKPHEPFILKDLKTELKFQFNLVNSLLLASQRPLLQNMLFYSTPSIKPGINETTRLISISGGEVVTFEGAMKNKEVIIFSCVADTKERTKFKENERKMYNTEWLLASIIKQKLEPLRKHLMR